MQVSGILNKVRPFSDEWQQRYYACKLIYIIEESFSSGSVNCTNKNIKLMKIQCDNLCCFKKKLLKKLDFQLTKTNKHQTIYTYMDQIKRRELRQIGICFDHGDNVDNSEALTKHINEIRCMMEILFQENTLTSNRPFYTRDECVK